MALVLKAAPSPGAPAVYALLLVVFLGRGLADTLMPTAGSCRVGGKSKDGTAVTWGQHEQGPAFVQSPLEALLLAVFPRQTRRPLLPLEQESAM